MKPNRVIYFFILLTILALAYFDSSVSLDSEVFQIKKEIEDRIKNTERMASLISRMPTLTGAVEFQSFNQLDIIIDNVFIDEPIVKRFYVLDDKLTVLHSNSAVGEPPEELPVDLRIDNKFNFRNGNLYLLHRVRSELSGNSFFTVFKINYLSLLTDRLSRIGLLNLALNQNNATSNSLTLPFLSSVDFKARLLFLQYYLGKNIFKILIIFLVLAFFAHFVIQRLLGPIKNIIISLKNISSSNTSPLDVRTYPRMFRPVIQSIIDANLTLREAESKRRELQLQKEKNEAVANVATQVAHDIRSPLEVLKSLKDEMQYFPESSRKRIQLSINRIEEITFNLLKKHKEEIHLKNEQRSEDLLGLLSSVITEKLIEYRNFEEIELIHNFSPECYYLFSRIQRSSFKSIVSNLLNNAIESSDSGKRSVRIDLVSSMDNNYIHIRDQGSGIPADVSTRLFTKGFTTKRDGNGLGLFNAKMEIEAAGGTLTFTTELGKGTTFTITLPKADPPPTFFDALHANKFERIIILDDDPAFHEVWAKKLSSLESKCEHIFSVKEIFTKYQVLDSKTLLLSDFELMDKELDGIDTFLKFNHAQNSILVTARSDEHVIQERCLKNGIKLLPKSLVNYISVTAGDNSVPSSIVLIDDDKLVHINWRTYCQKNSISFQGFKSIDEFLTVANTFNQSTRIYIDSNLGDGIKGEIESEKIFKLGFENLYLATGYQAGDIEKPAWIKEIFSKSPDHILGTI